MPSATPKRCSSTRRRPQPRQPGELRPTDVAGAFFVTGIAFLLAAAAAGVAQAVDPWPWGRWLALHLAFVGGVSALILGASQFFAGAFLATDPPPRALVRVQLLGWNLGAILLAYAVPEGSAALTWIAIGLLAVGLAAYGSGLLTMQRKSLRKSPWATRWYACGAGFFAFGIAAGVMLARGVAWTQGDLLSAHMALNLGGWFGAAIVGTLHTFYPSLTQTELRYGRLQDLAWAGWAGGVLCLAVGYAWSLDALALAGWLGLLGAGLALFANVAAAAGAAPRPLSLPARLLGLAQAFLLAGLLVVALTAIGDGPARALAGSTRPAAGTLLVAGWIGLTVLGSLMHLLAVVIRVRNFSIPMPLPRPGRDVPLTLLAAAGVAGLALAQLAGADGGRAPFTVVLVLAYLLLGGRVAMLAARVVARARPLV